MDHPLAGVQAKIDRAFQHAQALREEIAAFNPHEFYDTIDKERRQPQKGMITHTGFLHVKREPPIRFGIIAGDWAQNARAALDHLIYQVALLSARRRGDLKPVFFPIARTEAEYHAPGPCDALSLRDRALAGIPEEHRALVDGEQPYLLGRGEAVERHPLAVISAFSNTDKHRVLHAAAVRPLSVHAYPLVGECTVDVALPPRTPRVIADGAHIYTIRMSTFSGPDVKVGIDLTYAIGFGTLGIHDADMLNLCERIGDVVDKFRPLFD